MVSGQEFKFTRTPVAKPTARPVVVSVSVHILLHRLASAGGGVLIFDEAYHGWGEMWTFQKAVKHGYAAFSSFGKDGGGKELRITSAGRTALADSNKSERDRTWRRARNILHLRNRVRSSRAPFRGSAIRFVDRAIRKLRVALRRGHEFDP